MIRRLARLVPGALTRHALPVALGAIAVVLLVAIAATALVSPGTLGVNAARITEEKPLEELVAGLERVDADNDDLSDALENYVYGTDPDDWDSAKLGIPDGWLVAKGYDPLDPLTREARGRPPPPEDLPAAYADGYPLEYTPTLLEYYRYGMPAGYQPGVDAPWWRDAPHADPVAEDQTGTGIPTGWLVHHGLPLTGLDPERVADGSLGNLTIWQAWEHGTDPMERDSDADGLDDWVEIHVTRSDPSRRDTAGHGIDDGWLHRYGLGLFDVHVATQDPDRDGLTNREEFRIAGLHPLDWQTAQVGIPDGWFARYELDPLDPDVDRLIGKASDFPEYRTYVPEGFEPLPDVTFTIRGAYEYARPDDWNESVKGVWWGGTDPKSGDTDGDQLPDAVEIRGWYANVTFGTGPEAKPRVYKATSNPLEPDSDGDGLTDLEEYRGRAVCGDGVTRAFPPTDPRAADTAFSGLGDHEKVCGILRGDARYDATGLDPTKADSAGDLVKDGVRLDYWHERADALRANPRYPYNGSAYRTVFEWTEKYARFAGLTQQETLAEFRPDGDVDGDGVANLVDPDPSGALYVEKFAPGESPTKVFFLGGPEIDPEAYRLTEFASPVPHSASDPANPDTDGDGLPDAWEIRYGRFDPARGAWDLDPSKMDSDGDGVTDDKANNDADVVTWYAYERRGSSNERATRTFAFTNDLEFVAGTDPNEVSTAGDGIADGWKAFWGSRIAPGTYPNLVGARDASIGGVALERVEAIEAAIGESGITPTANLRAAGAKATGYVRLVNVPSCAADHTTQLRPGERVADTNACFSGTNLDNQQIKVLRIYGARTLAYADEARLRTNPFLADTDGDGAPDAYEAYFLVRTPGGTAYPDPTVDDSAKDPDGDGLRIDAECGSTDGARCGFETFRVDERELGAGADPNVADTDGDGIQDGIESGALINPLDPADVETFARADQDTDSDGIADFQELTGKDAKTFFNDPVRTNPKDADSDKDGLLDGETRTLDPAVPAQAALISQWSARGIAHKTFSTGMVDFLGERTFGPPFGLRPDTPQSAVAGVPDGWLAYYNQNPKEAPVSPAAYEANRPAWWDEDVHGVWWWGTVPGVTPPDDADGDGLHDRNGEDPFPGLNRLNVVVDGNASIRDPAQLAAWVRAAGDADAQRLRAQRIGEGAGDPSAARAAALNLVDAQNVYVRELRACVVILDVDAPDVVNKGEAFRVTGRVVLNERASGVCGAGDGPLLEGSATARVPAANRTVLVSVFSPTAERVIGAGFTGLDGSFDLTANITQEVRVAIPPGGFTLFGGVSGTAVSRFDPALIAAGATTGGEANRIVAWVYNTSTTSAPGDATHAPHPARIADRNGVVGTHTTVATRFAVSDPVPLTVRSTTRVVFEAPTVIENGARLEGDVRLVDASGGALSDRRLDLQWTGRPGDPGLPPVFTDRTGRVNLSELAIPVGVRASGDYELKVSFPSNDPDLLPSAGALSIGVRQPTRVVASLAASALTVGETLVAEGRVERRAVALPDGTTLDAAPVPAGRVTLSVGGVEETATLDAQGRFLVRLALPGNLVAGSQVATLRFEGTDDDAPSQATLPLDVKRTAEILGLNRLEGPRSIEVTLRGRLVDNEGQGFAGTIEVLGDEAGLLARGRAQNDGTFLLFVPLDGLELGTQLVRVVFPGDDGHASAQNLTQARVTTLTSIVLDPLPATLVRGTPLAVGARVVDDEGAPVPQQGVAIYWRGVKSEVRVTDAAGRVSFLLPTNASERPSPASVGLEFSPSATSVYQPSTAAHELRVLAGVSLTLEDASVSRGPIAISGRLVDDEGRPLPGSLVTLSLDGRRIGEARASRNGTWVLEHVLADDVPLGPHVVTARFANTSSLAGAERNATWHVRSALTLELTTVGPFVRGEAAQVAGRLVDDRGAPVDAPVTLLLAGAEIGAPRATRGELTLRATLPADLPRGDTVLRALSPQTAQYDALDVSIPTVVKIRPKVDVELPPVAIRGLAVGGSVTLTDDKGEPLRNTSYAYVIGKGKGAVLGATDASGSGALAGVAPTTGDCGGVLARGGAGDCAVALTVRGGRDVVPAQYTTTEMRVVGPGTIVGYAAIAIVALLVVLIAGLVVAAVVLRRRQIQEARDILDETIRDLLAGNEYAGTIFLAYRRFSAYLARHGFAEKAADTPREFAAGVRKALPIGATPLRSLIGLFEEARYSDHPIGSPERDAAVKALGEVRSELERSLGARKVSA